MEEEICFLPAYSLVSSKLLGYSTGTSKPFGCHFFPSDLLTWDLGPRTPTPWPDCVSPVDTLIVILLLYPHMKWVIKPFYFQHLSVFHQSFNTSPSLATLLAHATILCWAEMVKWSIYAPSPRYAKPYAPKQTLHTVHHFHLQAWALCSLYWF